MSGRVSEKYVQYLETQLDIAETENAKLRSQVERLKAAKKAGAEKEAGEGATA
jgi:hypothetical protein